MRRHLNRFRKTHLLHMWEAYVRSRVVGLFWLLSICHRMALPAAVLSNTVSSLSFIRHYSGGAVQVPHQYDDRLVRWLHRLSAKFNDDDDDDDDDERCQNKEKCHKERPRNEGEIANALSIPFEHTSCLRRAIK